MAAKVQGLTAENLAMQQGTQETAPSVKRQSLYVPEGPPHLTVPSGRRESRHHRPSVQYRRLSMASRTSVSGTSMGTKQIGMYPMKVQNTYKLEPDKSEKFRPSCVKAIIKEVLEECLDGEKYNPTQCRNFTQMIAEIIKGRVKDLCFHRYKIVCTVTVGQDSGQGVNVVSRCLWNKDTDNFAESFFYKDGLYAVATVYAIYLD